MTEAVKGTHDHRGPEDLGAVSRRNCQGDRWAMNETWVLLRGLVREARHWEGFPDMLRASRPGARVETLDLPGNGDLYLSDSPTSVSDMVDALREQLGSRGLKPPYHVMALSLGGMVALNWLQRFPDEVAAAVLINTSASGFNPFWQ